MNQESEQKKKGLNVYSSKRSILNKTQEKKRLIHQLNGKKVFIIQPKKKNL
jgi:hypothetical protein